VRWLETQRRVELFDNFHRKLSARTPPSAFLFLQSQFKRAHKNLSANLKWNLD
jgi:hypothetical protein